MSPANVRIFRLFRASGAILMSSVLMDGDTVGVGVRSSGEGGAAKRGAGTAATGATSGGAGWGAEAGADGAGRRWRTILVELARAISWFWGSRISASATTT